MILHIALKESIEMLRDGRYLWTAGILLILLTGALIAGWKFYADIEQQRVISQTVDREIWLDQGEKNQHSAAHFGSYAFKPTSPLTAIDQGLMQFTGVSVFMEAHSVKDAMYRPVDDATAVQRLGSLTASTTLQLLFPLLIILLAFGAFSGEREKGTMRQLLSLGVPRYALGFGKALGVAGPLLLMLIPAIALSVLFIALIGGPESTLWDSGRIGYTVLIYLLYFSVYILLSLVVSAHASSSRQSLLILIGFWFLTSFVVPRLTTDVAQNIHPTPTASEFELAIDEDMARHPSWTDRTAAVQARLMDEHGVETVEEIPESVAGHTLLEAEGDETAVYRKHFELLQNVYHEQERITQAGSILSPLLAVQLSSMGFAGSDHFHHRDFVDAAETYRFDYVQMLNQDMVDVGAAWDYTADRELWEKIPAFNYEPPAISAVVDHYGLSLGLLGLWTLVLITLTPVALANMKIG